MKSIKEIVKKRILEMGISSEEFSIRSGFTPQYLNKIYTKNSTSIDTLENMAKVLGIDVGVFFDKDDSLQDTSKETKVINADYVQMMEKYIKVLEENNKLKEELLTSKQNKIDIQKNIEGVF
jgi:transcriptional regulator with XRE-family HTH domain